MLKDLLAKLWRASPARARRLGVWLTQARFTVTAGAVVLDEGGRVLLLQHTFRGGSGWGIPGGFVERGEQPGEAIRRELREEVGVEIDDVRLVAARAHRRPRQIELLYSARVRAGDRPRAASAEIKRAEWFAPGEPPAALSRDQRRLISRALENERGGGE
jgi:ADP-ribose pyrophosphatase YjhB (NUDIX family)